MSSTVMGDPSPDLPSSSEDHSSPESSPSPLPPSESPVSENMTATLSPEQFSRPGLASSEEMSATPETAPFSASPTVQPSPMEILEFQVARAKAKEDELCTVLDEAYKQETDLFQEAQDARQKAKDQDLKAKKIRAEVIALKARAQEFEKKVKALKSLRPDREKEVEEAQHERADVEKKLEDMKYEEMLVERYSDVVIRKLIKRTEKDYELNEIFEGFMVGDARLQDAEALEVELDNICEEISREKAETLSAGSGTPNGEEVKEEDADGKTADHPESSASDILNRAAMDAGHGADEGMDSKAVYIKSEPGTEVDQNGRDVSVKLELGVKVEPDVKDEEIGSNLTEMGLRAHLRNFKAALQTLQDQTRLLMGGKRKREDDED